MALKTYEIKCSCGHTEPRLMQESTRDFIVQKRGALITEMPCEKCTTPEMDPRKAAR